MKWIILIFSPVTHDHLTVEDDHEQGIASWKQEALAIEINKKFATVTVIC